MIKTVAVSILAGIVMAGAVLALAIPEPRAASEHDHTLVTLRNGSEWFCAHGTMPLDYYSCFASKAGGSHMQGDTYQGHIQLPYIIDTKCPGGCDVTIPKPQAGNTFYDYGNNSAAPSNQPTESMTSARIVGPILPYSAHCTVTETPDEFNVKCPVVGSHDEPPPIP